MSSNDAMSNDDVIDELNTLIETCKDGEYGFRTCAEHVKSSQLRQVFTSRADECRQGATELQSLVTRLGGKADTAQRQRDGAPRLGQPQGHADRRQRSGRAERVRAWRGRRFRALARERKRCRRRGLCSAARRREAQPRPGQDACATRCARPPGRAPATVRSTCGRARRRAPCRRRGRAATTSPRSITQVAVGEFGGEVVVLLDEDDRHRSACRRLAGRCRRACG